MIDKSIYFDLSHYVTMVYIYGVPYLDLDCSGGWSNGDKCTSENMGYVYCRVFSLFPIQCCPLYESISHYSICLIHHNKNAIFTDAE